MKRKQQFYTFEEAVIDYQISTAQINGDFRKASRIMNTCYFDSFSREYLFCLVYMRSSISKGSPILRSPGALCFCENSIVFSNENGFDFNRDEIKISEIKRFAIYTKVSAGRVLADYLGFDSSFIVFFLKNKSQKVFDIKISDAIFALSQLSVLCEDVDFAFSLTCFENDTYYFSPR